MCKRYIFLALLGNPLILLVVTLFTSYDCFGRQYVLDTKLDLSLVSTAYKYMVNAAFVLGIPGLVISLGLKLKRRPVPWLYSVSVIALGTMITSAILNPFACSIGISGGVSGMYLDFFGRVWQALLIISANYIFALLVLPAEFNLRSQHKKIVVIGLVCLCLLSFYMIQAQQPEKTELRVPSVNSLSI